MSTDLENQHEDEGLAGQPPSPAHPRRYPGRARGAELLAAAIFSLAVFPFLAPLVWLLARRRLAAAGRLRDVERGLAETARLVSLFAMVWLALLAILSLLGRTPSFFRFIGIEG